jgi:hypothetical protein
MSLGVNQSCSTCPRVQIIPELCDTKNVLRLFLVRRNNDLSIAELWPKINLKNCLTSFWQNRIILFLHAGFCIKLLEMVGRYRIEEFSFWAGDCTYSVDDHSEAKFLVLTVGYSRLWHRVIVPARHAGYIGLRAGTTLRHIIDYNLQSGTKNLASEVYGHKKILLFFGFRPAFWRCVALQDQLNQMRSRSQLIPVRS